MASLRKVHTVYTDGNIEARVYRDVEWNEFRVKFYIEGVHQTNSDAHCTDKAEAIETATVSVCRLYVASQACKDTLRAEQPVIVDGPTNARGQPVDGDITILGDESMTTHTVKTNADLQALDLSFYSLCKLANVLNCVDPTKCLEHRLTHPAWADKGWQGHLTLDHLGNFVSFK